MEARHLLNPHGSKQVVVDQGVTAVVPEKVNGSDVQFKESDFTLEEAIVSIGYGRYQIKLMVLCGIWWGVDAMEIMLLSFLLFEVKREWELSRVQQSFIACASFSGIFLGSLIWGIVADKWGRKKGYLAVTVFASVFGFASTFSPSYPFLLILRGLFGIGAGGAPVSFSMFTEFLPVKGRGAKLVIFEIFWTIGTAAEAGIAWGILSHFPPDIAWRMLLGLTAVPFFMLLFFFPFLPESPRYLLIKGRTEEAWAVLRDVAKANGKRLPPGKLIQKLDPQNVSSSPLQLLSPEFRRLTIPLWIVWFCNSAIYYGLVLFTPEYFSLSGGNGDTLEPGDYIAIFVTTSAELPGLLIAGMLVDRIGRIRTQAGCFIVCGACTFGLLVGPHKIVGLVLLMGGRAMIMGAFCTTYAYTPEAYPTYIRATALGWAGGFSKIASIITPFAPTLLLDIQLYIPIIIFGSASAVAAVCSLLLPFETKGKELKV